MKNNWIRLLLIIIGLAISLAGTSLVLINQIHENRELLIEIERRNIILKKEINLIKSQTKKSKEDLDYLFYDLYYIEDTLSSTPSVNDIFFKNLNNTN